MNNLLTLAVIGAAAWATWRWTITTPKQKQDQAMTLLNNIFGPKIALPQTKPVLPPGSWQMGDPLPPLPDDGVSYYVDPSTGAPLDYLSFRAPGSASISATVPGDEQPSTPGTYYNFNGDPVYSIPDSSFSFAGDPLTDGGVANGAPDIYTGGN